MAFNLVRYSQQDPQWKNTQIGGGPDTIGYIGCALTSTAMLVSSWGYTETPASLNKKLNAVGGFINEAIVWSAVTKIYPQVKSNGLTICGNGAPLSQIDASLAAGQPVIVEVDHSPAAGLQTHWVLVYAKQGNDYVIQDPWPYPQETNQVTLMSRFSQGKPLGQAIKAVAWYQVGAAAPAPAPAPGGGGSTTPPAPTPSPLPTPIETDLYIQPLPTATAGIKLHTQPTPDSTANYAEMPSYQLQVIEDKTGALAKIGQNNQWIYVRDPSGHQGYVAAWFVQQSSAATPSPAPAPTPAPAPAPTPAPSTPPPASVPDRFQVVVVNSVGLGGLAVRQQPSQGASKVNTEKAGARLTVIEPGSTAMPKIGVAGQWLAVKATNNQRGYVMAQYVKLLGS